MTAADCETLSHIEQWTGHRQPPSPRPMKGFLILILWILGWALIAFLHHPAPAKKPTPPKSATSSASSAS